MTGFKRIEARVLQKDNNVRTVAFEGREIACWEKSTIEHTAYVTPKENIAIVSTTGETTLTVFESFEELEERQKKDFLYPQEFVSEITDEIDEEYVEELDL